MAKTTTRRQFLIGTASAAGAALLGRAPAALGQQVRELQVWHTEVEPQTVKTIQDTSIAEFERKFPGFKVKQQALGWGDLNTKLLAALAAGSPPDLTHLNPFMTASLWKKGLLRPMDELIRALGEKDIHEATLKLQLFDGKYYGVTHAMGATYIAERRDLREQKGLKPPETHADFLKLTAALTDDGKRYGLQMPGEKLYIGFVHPAEWLASNGGSWVDAKTWRPQLNGRAMVSTLEYLQKLNKYMPAGWSGQKYLDTLAALSTGKVAMVYLSGARTIGYIERYAPEGMRDPEHFQPMFKPRGPSGPKGISALDGENWAVFTQSKYPNEAFEFLRMFYKREHYLKYCHTVPIHLTPIFKSMLNDPEYLAHPRIQKWRTWHDFMVTGLSQGRFLPIGFSRPDDNLLPFLAELDGSGIVADLIVEVMVGEKNPKAEADRAQKRAEELLAQLGFKRWS
ncbi:MAG TPA: extracellular solute-binding protein [Methylomirabilota bacterium]|jgi:ABC-type glycerol-3-phosphate transport system substrate-binding protein|nr:extracellular solute-binding protein [Methylomirabilota bacterium]